ncbi:hypothetical protein [Pectobacterium jejuense]|uniref:hypothetical protein n=1 Tax=Pectobacterium jejuense TaxID=2974022 RepID=UPI002280F4BE|nr:hypothetical protein [Pectobacterium jejuense]MCY9848957.1 hypothetical protein [Pectobacterium jejuense]
MERFVASAAVNKQAPTNKEKYNFDIWEDVANQLVPAFFTEPVTGKKRLDTTVKGVEIAKNVIQFLGSVIAGNVTIFAKFLQTFGKGFVSIPVLVPQKCLILPNIVPFSD